jgi:hypothetical protein
MEHFIVSRVLIPTTHGIPHYIQKKQNKRFQTLSKVMFLGTKELKPTRNLITGKEGESKAESILLYICHNTIEHLKKDMY